MRDIGQKSTEDINYDSQMTLTQIAEDLPNGFHDAEIEQLIWDFQHGSAIFEMDFWISSENDQDREKRRQGTIELHEIAFLAIDPPEPRQSDPKPYRSSVGTLQIDGVLTNDEVFPRLPKLKPQLPPTTKVFSFYVVNWNSFIHIAAAEAKLTWKNS